jgi:carbon monoxide dehydrogenase subunit G
MAIVFEHGIDLPQSPHQVFLFLDDFKKVPLWLKRCEGVAKEGYGPNQVGDKLRYAYREGNHHGVMDGDIVTYEADRCLGYRYYDSMFSVAVDFRIEPKAEGGTRLIHRIEIKPHSLMAKLIGISVRGRIPKQTVAAMENIRSLLAQGA